MTDARMADSLAVTAQDPRRYVLADRDPAVPARSRRPRERRNLPKRAGLRFGVGHDRQTTQGPEMRRDLCGADALVAFGPCQDIADLEVPDGYSTATRPR